MTKNQVIEIFSRNKNRLRALHVNALFIFGSVVHDQARPDSDVDILVEFDPSADVGLFAIVRLKAFISEILGCNADLVTPEG